MKIPPLFSLSLYFPSYKTDDLSDLCKNGLSRRVVGISSYTFLTNQTTFSIMKFKNHSCSTRCTTGSPTMPPYRTHGVARTKPTTFRNQNEPKTKHMLDLQIVPTAASKLLTLLARHSWLFAPFELRVSARWLRNMLVWFDYIMFPSGQTSRWGGDCGFVLVCEGES